MRIDYLFAFSILSVAACVADDSDELPFAGEADEAAKADAATVALTPLTNVNISSSRLQRGGTYVLTSRNAWYRTMGTASPTSVDFSKEWVVFYGMGVRNTGGYSADVTSLGYDADDRSLIVSTHATSPGPGCIVTQALTNPHFVAKFKIPSPRPQFALSDHSDEVRDCGTEQELIRYRSGNQISASDLLIMSDGSFDHQERHTPTDIRTIDHAPLTAAKLTELRGWIAKAATGTFTRSDGGPTSLGSTSGYLIALQPNGSEVVIVKDERDTDGDGLNDVTVNNATEASRIRTMIESLVEHDLP